MAKKKMMGIYGIWDKPAVDALENSGIITYMSFSYCPIYVGQSIDMETRWDQHRKMLEKGCHHNYLLQKHVDLIGIDALEFSVLESVNHKRDLNSREIYWIHEFGWAHLCNINEDKLRIRAEVDHYMRTISILDELGLMPTERIRIEGRSYLGRRVDGEMAQDLDYNLDILNEAKQAGFEGGIIQVDKNFFLTFN